MIPYLLTQQMAGSGITNPAALMNPAPDEPEGEPIIVTAPTTGEDRLLQAPGLSEQGMLLGNTAAVEDVRAAEEALPERKGMFGVKGTLRDVLGLLGDTYLTTNGRQAVYNPRRQQEREADAMAGFSDNPMAAVERLAAHNPKAAQALYNDIVQQQRQAEQMQMQRQQHGNNLYGAAIERIGQVAGSITQENYASKLPLLNRLKQLGGLGDEFVIPEQFDPKTVQSWQQGGLSGYDQARVRDMDRDAADLAAYRAANIRNQREIAGIRANQSDTNNRRTVGGSIIREREGNANEIEKANISQAGQDGRTNANNITRASIANSRPVGEKQTRGPAARAGQVQPRESEVRILKDGRMVMYRNGKFTVLN